MIATLTPIGIAAVSGAILAFLGSCLLLAWAIRTHGLRCDTWDAERDAGYSEEEIRTMEHNTNQD